MYEMMVVDGLWDCIPLLMIKVCDCTVHICPFWNKNTLSCDLNMSCFFCLLGIGHDYMSLTTKPIASINQMWVKNEQKPLKERPFLVTKKTLPAKRSLVKSCFKVVMLPRCLGSQIVVSQIAGFFCCWFISEVFWGKEFLLVTRLWWTTVNHYSSQKWPRAADRADPLGSNIAGLKIHHLSRCISYSRWGFSSQICLFKFTGG